MTALGLALLVVTPHRGAWWQLALFVPIAGFIGAAVAIAAYVFIPGVRQAVNEVTVAVLKAALDAIWFVLKPLVDTVNGLVQFVGEWLSAIGQYFGGNLILAVTRIVLVAAYLWVFDHARQIPVIGQILEDILHAVQVAIKFANDLFDEAQRKLEGLRADLASGLERLFASFGDIGKALRQDILQTVDTLIGGVEGKLVRARVELIHRVDVVALVLGTRVTVLGQTFSIVPDTVRQYLLTFERYHPRQALDQAQAMFAGLGFAPPEASPGEVAPWVTLDEASEAMSAARTGGGIPEAGYVDDAVEQMRATLRGVAAEVGDWPEIPEPPPPPGEPEPSIPIPPEIAVPA